MKFSFVLALLGAPAVRE